MSKALFWALYSSPNENDVNAILTREQMLASSMTWHPLGQNESNFGVIENQQSNPVAAIVEKLTNSIDATLMRRCYEEGINPKGAAAPRSVDEAVARFFPDHKNWDLPQFRNQQAEGIQIIGDSRPGDTSDTSLIIYDDGEGQHPEDFEDTFLSLLRGNKNEIHFVQGKYNMGGSGAIVFCGKKRYQLIASKRFDSTGLFGFTLIRKHPLTEAEARTKKNTWYEYLKIDGRIPAFPIDELDLGLHNRPFRTGTIIKLYSYDLKGNRHVRRDLGRSLNEFLYAPALPIYTVETAERYPNDRGLTAVIFGLKRRLQDATDYVEETFSESYMDHNIGRLNVTVHVFKARAKGRNAKETRDYIQGEFFKNNMAVLFTVNGQVHGHYTSEFITRSLRFNLLKDHLLIHVDCTELNLDFRNELFMASRDRLKQGEDSTTLRRTLADNLRTGQLQEIYKRRKDTISVDAEEDDELLRTFAENLPISNELRGLLSQTFKLDREDKPKKRPTPKSDNGAGPKVKQEFHPKRFPSFFELDGKNKNGRPVIAVPAKGSKTIKFNTDVENQYFDRVDEPGEMQIAVMGYKPNDATGGNKRGSVNELSQVLTVTRRSPNEGAIRVVMKPTEDVHVGEEVEIQVNLSSPGEDLTERFWVKISEPLPRQQHEVPKPEEEKIGLPKHILVYQHPSENLERMTWERLSEQAAIDMDFGTVIHPQLEGDVLETIYINMDSSVLKNYKSGIRNLTVEQNQLADRRYISSVYFHTLFLYVINRQRQYGISRTRENQEPEEIDLADYLKDLFSSHYAAFLMNFGMGELVDALG